MSLTTGESMHYACSTQARCTQNRASDGAVQLRESVPTILSQRITMKSRTNSLTGSPETTASSSTKYSESDDDSDRHSTTSSVETPPTNKESQSRKKDKEMKRRESDDDRLPVKFRRKNDEYSKRNQLQNSPRNHRHRFHQSYLSRSPEVRDENRRRTTKRDEEYRRRSRSREEYRRKRSRSRSFERYHLSKSRRTT
ncbi:unnamed protein product, partial [Onchocerca flexuosa]|uniref:Transformer n=1 Tax=Onchocerca flexuosa TaxID=387005 RepID=A0A183I607_9BILA